MTYHINLQLGDPAQAILVPRGGFFQITGGRWMYVVDESGKLPRAVPSGSDGRTRNIMK